MKNKNNNPIRYIDPTGLCDEEKWLRDQEIKTFKDMNAKDQLAFLKNEVEFLKLQYQGATPEQLKSLSTATMMQRNRGSNNIQVID